MPPDRRLVVTTNAATVRRSLVPSAWMVLEELALGADLEQVAVTSSRQLAEDLGISKDTAARSLRTLMAAGLVGRLEQRDPSTGRFGTVAYVVDVVAAGFELVPAPRPTAPAGSTVEPSAPIDDSSTKASSRPTRHRASGRSDAASTGDQLDLFGADR